MATAQTLLTAVNTAIETRLNGGAVQSYTIGNRNVAFMSLRDLQELRRTLQQEVSLLAGKNKTFVQFVQPK